MAICERGHTFWNMRKCPKCSKEDKEKDDMQGEARETGQGKPSGLFTMSFIEIYYLCECTWVFYDVRNPKMRKLKYMSSQCPAMNWHRSQGMTPERPIMVHNWPR